MTRDEINELLRRRWRLTEQRLNDQAVTDWHTVLEPWTAAQVNDALNKALGDGLRAVSIGDITSRLPAPKVEVAPSGCDACGRPSSMGCALADPSYCGRVLERIDPGDQLGLIDDQLGLSETRIPLFADGVRIAARAYTAEAPARKIAPNWTRFGQAMRHLESP